MADDAKKKILARRAQFVAAALAGLSAEACHKEAATKPDAAVERAPEPCLAVPFDYYQPADAAKPPEPQPQPCLKIAPPKPDAGK